MWNAREPLRRLHPVRSDGRPVWATKLRADVCALAVGPAGAVAGTVGGDVVVVVDGQVVRRLAGHRGAVRGVGWHGDRVVSGGDDGVLRWWGDDRPLDSVSLGAAVRALAASDAGVLAGLADGRVVWWQPRVEATIQRDAGPGPVVAVALAGDRGWTGHPDGRVCAWGMTPLAIAAEVGGAPVEALAVVDGRPLVLRADGTVGPPAGATRALGPGLLAGGAALRVATGRRLSTYSPELEPIGWQPGVAAPIAAIAAGDRVVTAAAGGVLEAWDDPWPLDRPALGHDDVVRCVAFGPGVLASGGKDQRLRLWDPGTGLPLARHDGHQGSVEAVAVDLDGIATASADGTVRLWSADGVRRAIRVSAAPLSAVALAGDAVVSAGHDGALHLHDRGTGARLARFEAHDERVRGLAVHRTGVIASVGYDGVLAVWDPSRRRTLGRVPAHPGPVISVCARHDGWATASLDGTVAVWDRASTRVATLSGHTGGVVGVAAYRDGLVSAGIDGTVRVWTPDGRCDEIVELGVPLTSVSTDGTRVAVGTRAGDVQVLG